jgi:hypothetical protein
MELHGPWKAALERWEMFAQGALSAATTHRYRFAVQDYLQFCGKLANEPHELPSNAVEQWLSTRPAGSSKAALNLQKAAARSFHKMLAATDVKAETPNPPQKEEAANMASNESVEPVIIGGVEEALLDAQIEHESAELDGEDGDDETGGDEGASSALEQDADVQRAAAKTAKTVLLQNLEKANAVRKANAAARKAAAVEAKAAAKGHAAQLKLAGSVAADVRLPSNQRLAVYKRKDDGTRAFCKHYTTDDFKGTDAASFVSQFVTKSYGYGLFEIEVLNARNEAISVHPVTVEQPADLAKGGVDDPLYMVKELIALTKSSAPDAGAKRAQIMGALGLGNEDRPMSTRDLFALMPMLQQQPQGMDMLKLLEVAEKLGGRRSGGDASPAQPLLMPPAPDPMAAMTPLLQMMMQAQQQNMQMMIAMMTKKDDQKTDPMVMEMLKMVREENRDLRTKLDQSGPASIVDTITELKQAQDVLRGVPGMESLTGESGGFGAFFSKIIENSDAVGELIGSVAERITQAKARAIFQRPAVAAGAQRRALPAQTQQQKPQQRPQQPGAPTVGGAVVPAGGTVSAPAGAVATVRTVALPAEAVAQIQKLANAEDDGSITEAAVETISILAADPQWQERLIPYQEAMQNEDTVKVKELIASLFNLAGIPAKATPLRLENIVGALKRTMDGADDDAGADEEQDNEEQSNPEGTADASAVAKAS